MFKTNFMPLFEAPADGGAAGAAAAAAAAPAAGSGNPWYQGRPEATPEVIAHWANRGMADKTPAEVALMMTKAHMELNRVQGIPANEILRMPKDAADEQGWQALRTRLGVPTDPNQYNDGIKAVKRADGNPIDQTMVDLGRELAAKVHLPAADAPALVQGIVAHLDSRDAAVKASEVARVEAGRAEIKQDWGANYDANRMIASNAIAKLGFKPEVWAALEQVSSYKDVMMAALKLGQMTGEDKLVLGNNNVPTSPGLMSVEQAMAQKAELMRDEGWKAKNAAGDREARRLMLALNARINNYTGPMPTAP